MARDEEGRVGCVEGGGARTAELEGVAAAARERDLARQASFKAAEAKAAEAAEAAAATPQRLLADAAAALAALPPEGAELLEKVSGWQADEVGRLTIRLRCQQTLLKKRAAAGGAAAPEPPDLPARAAAWSASHLAEQIAGVGGGGGAAATLLAVCRELIRRELPPSRHLPLAARQTNRERDALRWCEDVVATLGPLSLLHVRNEWILGAVADQRRAAEGTIGAQRDWLRQQEEERGGGPAAKKKNDGWV